jgi:RNA polymerase-interacting CarD/CdnL/TRCF family regulator
MLDTARTLLVQELALAKGVENSDVVRELDTMFPLQ